LLGLLGVALLSGGAFVLGLRHGRTELRIEPPADGGVDDDAATALALVEQFHEFSAHSRTGLLRRAPGVEWGDAPPPFKTHAPLPGRRRLRLAPPHTVDGEVPLRFDAAALGTLLWHTAGISLRSGGIAFRTAPSSGALFSTELYVAVAALPGVAPGIWHYDAQAHALHPLSATAPGAAALGLDSDAVGGHTLAVVVATAVFRRSGHKYRDRSYRYVLADLGHALQNLRVAARALGVQAQLQPWFDGARVAATLGVDEAEEGVLALAVVSRLAAEDDATGASAALDAPGVVWPLTDARFDAARPRAPDAASPPAGARWSPPPLVAAGSAPLGVTDAMHRATSLRAAAPAARGVAASDSEPPHAAGERVALALQPARKVDALALIARRRSLRRYAATPVALHDVSALLAAMGRQSAQLSAAVRIDLLSTAVDGLPPAAWRYAPAAHALHLRVRHASGLRRRARAAALDQDVIGDAAAVFVLSMSRAGFAADPAGAARGYRHAFLEAGLVGERLYLEAVRLGLGVCAVGAFYDDEASALVGVDPRREWVIHFAAVGVPG